jgi:hypothetical protein
VGADGPEEEAGASGVIEVVGRFANAESFKAAVKALRAAGFEPSDLSVLDTHESRSASERPSEAWKQSLAGLVGEVKYVGPLTTAGLIAIATGQIGMAVAGVVAAGVTGVALRELLEDIKATPHTEAFARALESGAVLLWVAAETPERQAEAGKILSSHGAADVHTHRRPGL